VTRDAGDTVAAMRVSLFVTCLVDLVDPDVAVATVRLLRAAGCEVTVPENQTCCGQPAWNSGFAHEAAAVARTSLEALEADGADAVVVPAGSCTTMIRVFWPELFETVGDHDAAERARNLAARTKELSELLAERGDALPPLSLPEPVRVAYHHSCHMLRELHLDRPPIDALDRVAGCTRVDWPADQRCCGFGGLFSMKLPEASEAMADHKLDELAGDPPDIVVGADSSCLLHLRARAEHEGRPIVTCHLAQLLAGGLP
jgi:L-lactate dehydrogenase complex protein LldE